MQQHASRQAAGKREPEGTGGAESAAASHPDVEHNARRPDTTQRDLGGNTFLQSLKARYATRSSPETLYRGRNHAEAKVEYTCPLCWHISARDKSTSCLI